MTVASTSTPTQVLVLLSGGLDSSCCIAFYLGKQFEVEALFVDYGHPAASSERAAAAAVAKHYGVNLRESIITGVPSQEAGFVPARNALLVCAALACGSPKTGLVALGIHSGTPYPDCTPRFIEACQALTDIYDDGRIQIVAPFVDWTKGDIITFAKKFDIPTEKTYSCEAGGPEPCGVCLSCKDYARGR